MTTPTASVIHAHSGKNGGSPSSSFGVEEGWRVGNGVGTVGGRVGIGLIVGIELDEGILLIVGSVVGTGAIATVGLCVSEGITGNKVTGATTGPSVAGAVDGAALVIGC